MKPYYYKGYTVAILPISGGYSCVITEPEQMHETRFECKPINSDTLDARKFCNEFIDGVLLNDKTNV